MRIMHVIMSFHPDSVFSGPKYDVYAYSKGLLQRGHHVTVCSSDRLDPQTRISGGGAMRHGFVLSSWDGIDVVFFGSLHPGYGGYGTVVSTSLITYLHREICGYDVVHIHGTRHFFGAVTALMARAHQVPYVIQPHNTLEARLRRIALKKVFDRLLRDSILRHASAIIALTPDEKEECLRLFNEDIDKVFVVPSLMPTVPLSAKGGFRKEYGIAGDQFLILYLGRVYEGKGIEHVIQALSLLGIDSIRLAIVGPDRGYRAHLEAIVEDCGLNQQVLFTGPIYGDAKFAAYEDADIFVLPSMFDQLPVSVLEASVCMRPSIISDRCGMTKMVTETQAGLVVPYGSPQALAESIRALYENSELRRHLGENAKLMVQRYCSPSAVIDSLELVYRQAWSKR